MRQSECQSNKTNEMEGNGILAGKKGMLPQE